MAGIDQGKTEPRLESWKEIAGFFDRDEKTVRRWEKELRLPVHRLPGVSKGRVYAFPQELTEWSEKPREAKAELTPDTAPVLDGPTQQAADTVSPSVPPVPAQSLPRRRILYAAATLVLFVPLAFFGFARSRTGLRESGFSIAERLGLISRNPSPRAAKRIPSPEAERLYLEGRYYWNERTAEGFTHAIDDFTQAIVADPQCAKAYAGLADSYSLIREYTSMPEDEALQRAEAAARKAVELDPNLSEAHRALAFPLFWWKHDVPTAEHEFERAIALNPNDGTARLWYANALTFNGEHERALEQINRAQELDPSSSSVRADKGRVLYDAGKKDEAIALLRQMKKNEPAFVSPHRYLAQIYFEEGQYPEYFLEAAEVARLVNRPDDLKLIEAEKNGFTQGGANGLLQSRLEEQKKLYQKDRTPAYALAETAALLGKKTEALTYLKASRQRHESEFAFIERDCALRNLRDEPDYRRMLVPTHPRSSHSCL